MVKVHIANIILYDKTSEVMGFVELQSDNGQTIASIQHNISGNGLIFSLSYKDQTHAFSLSKGPKIVFTINQELDLGQEIFAFITRKEKDKLSAVASGVMNIAEKLVKSETITLPTEEPVQIPQPEPQEQEFDHVPEPIHDAPQGKIESELKSVEVLNRAKEVDQVLRAVCSFEEGGLNACKACPYREHFFRKKASEG
ncbi:MAG: hypothetical protein FWE01_02760 [Firmicutes bacterium]|nr:hypothetical protein [Bacillota bacterium]